MIRRFRKWAMLWPGAAMLLASLALAASASQPASPPNYVTMSEMERYFITKGLSFGVALLGGIWLIYGALEKARDKREQVRWDNIGKAIESMVSSISSLSKALVAHNEDEGAHTKASKHNHGPIMDVLAELKDGQAELRNGQSELRVSLARLIAEHDIIRENECRLLRGRLQRRESDPPDLDIDNIRGIK